ncbi:DUF6884 domain-containing protein [Streptomyces sp. NPDC020794]|uniref:DUF6884 domain-containing protein n=1 Tax=unclassified Streptomyces TaxID=2593676 RepID=UPI0036E01B03
MSGHSSQTIASTRGDLRVVGGERRSVLAANRLSLPFSAGVRFLSALKGGVSTEGSDDSERLPRLLPTRTRACRRAADALRPDRLLILSARYGLLDLDEVINPYDTPHGAADAITAQALLKQATVRDIVLLDPVVALGGARHVGLVRAVWPHARTPLAGTHAMGEQMARLTVLRKGRDQRLM